MVSFTRMRQLIKTYNVQFTLVDWWRNCNSYFAASMMPPFRQDTYEWKKIVCHAVNTLCVWLSYRFVWRRINSPAMTEWVCVRSFVLTATDRIMVMRLMQKGKQEKMVHASEYARSSDNKWRRQMCVRDKMCQSRSTKMMQRQTRQEKLLIKFLPTTERMNGDVQFVAEQECFEPKRSRGITRFILYYYIVWTQLSVRNMCVLFCGN